MKRFLTGFLLAIVFFVSQTSNAYAGRIPTGIPCTSKQSCIDSPDMGKVDPSRVTCDGGECMYLQPSTIKSAIPQVDEVEEAQLQSVQNKQMDRNVYFAGDNRNGAIESSAVAFYQLLGWGKVVGESGGELVYSGGALSSAGDLIALLYNNPPASTQSYLADLFHSAHIVEPAYAQGLGFAALTPILPAWKMFRNVSYFFFVIIVIVIGFMIMLRQKVGSAAVTAQQALPRIVLALLAVTFSYAIAGLLIDIMYLLMLFLANLFGEQDKVNISVFKLAYEVIKSGGDDSYHAIGDMLQNIMGEHGLLADILTFLPSLTAGIIFALAAIFAVFKLFFELVKTYITIVISIIMAPLMLMMEAIPGKSAFKGWIQSLIANLAAFPTVLLVLIIHNQLANQSATSGGFMPPYLLGSEGSADVVKSIIGLGLLLGLPEAVSKVKKALGASEGPFGDILKAGMGRFGKAADVGVPTIPGAYGAIQGGISGLRQGMRTDIQGETGWQRTKRLARSAYSGAPIYNEQGELLRNVGGAAPRAKVGWGVGRSIRGTIDDIQEGRILEPDNWRKFASQIAAAQNRKETDKEKVKPVAPSNA